MLLLKKCNVNLSLIIWEVKVTIKDLQNNNLYVSIRVWKLNYYLHDFWNVYEGVDVIHETQNFIKNLGVLVAFLLLAAVNIEDNRPKIKTLEWYII